MINLLIGYMWLFIHRPFEVWPWLGEYRIERIYMLVTMACWLFAPKTWTRSRLNFGVVLLAISILVSSLLSRNVSHSFVATENWFKLAVFYVIIMGSVKNVTELKTLIVSFVIVMGIYELHSLFEYMNGRGQYRMGTWRMIAVDSSLSDPNSFAASVLYGLPLAWPVFALCQSKWKRRLLIVFVGLGIVCILLTGSRTGFVALLVGSIAAVMITRYRWWILGFLLLCAPLFWRNLPDELRNRYITIIDPSGGPANARQSAESRERYFFMALEIWKDEPLFGVGPLEFSRASGTGQQAHTLYGEVLSELGAFGAVALAVLVWGFTKNYRIAQTLYQDGKHTESQRFCYLTVAATMSAVLLLLFLGLGGHNIFRFTWLWYAAFSALAVRFLQEDIELANRADDRSWIQSQSSFGPSVSVMCSRV